MPITGRSDINDRLVGTNGDDSIDGLSGLDVVTYTGKFTDYSLAVNNGVFTLTDNNSLDGNDGVDTLVNIEKLLFLGDNKQISLSTEAIVNVETSGEQIDTTVLKLPGGGFINFWYAKVMTTTKVVNPDDGTETEVTAETKGYYFRIFDANGKAADLDKKIIADTDGKMSGFKAAIQSDGSIVIAWSEPDADKNGVYMQLFKADGTEKSTKMLVNDTLTDDQLQPSIAVLSDDSIVVAWTSANQGDSLQHDGVQMGGTPNQAGVFSQHFDKSGNPLGWETKVSFSGAGDAFVTALNNGGYVIGHEGTETGTEKMTISATFYGQNDQPVKTVVTVNTTLETTKTEVPDPDYNELASREKLPTAAKLENGNVIMVWQAPRDAYPTTETHDAHDGSIIARLFTASGDDILVNSELEFVINTFTTYEQSQPAVAALTNQSGTGGFVVVWQSMLQDTSYWGVYGQRFDQNGNKVGSEFQVNGKIHDSQQKPSVIGLDDGGFVVSWEAQFQDGNQQGSFQPGNTATEIVQQRYDANGVALGQSFAGGNGNDTISIGGSSDIEIAGGLGNDSLTSGSGNDTLRGGAGNDTFDAGLGNNTIIGGDGTDTLKLVGKYEDYVITGTNGKYQVKHIAKDAGGNAIRDNAGNLTFDRYDNLSSTETLLINNKFYNLSGEQGGEGTVGLELEDLVTDGNAIGQPALLEGTSGDDSLKGGNIKGRADTLEGGNGNDLYIAADNGSKIGAATLIIIYDTGGNDTLRIASKIDLSNPGANKSTKGLDYIENVELLGKAALALTGSAGDNKLVGNEGANKISGGGGNDSIYGGLGKDTLTGGDGTDKFIFDTSPAKGNIDAITDFSGDKLVLDSRIFKGLDANADGKLDEAQFRSGAGSKKADVDTASFMVYDTSTGFLYYDAEGEASVQIAKVGLLTPDAKGKLTVFNPASLTISDFDII